VQSSSPPIPSSDRENQTPPCLTPQIRCLPQCLLRSLCGSGAHAHVPTRTSCAATVSSARPSAYTFKISHLKRFSLYNITTCFMLYVHYHTWHVWHVKYHTYFFILVFLMNHPKVSFWQFFLLSPHESTACRISHPTHPTLFTHT
jgi:hypothetical protein